MLNNQEDVSPPMKDADRRKIFKEALDKANSRYPKALKKLAEFTNSENRFPRGLSRLL